MFIQPQAQVVWMGVKTDAFRDQSGTKVKPIGHGNVQTRLGARVFVDTDKSSYESDAFGTQLFSEVNWIHNTKAYDVRLDEDTVYQGGGRNLVEVKVGVENKINKNLHFWVNGGVQAGKKQYRDLSAVGLKYSF